MAIEKVAVLGAGVMGQGIAAHLANAGIPSLLFDISPREGGDPRAMAKAGIANIGKLKPPALYRAADVGFITACNYDADAARLGECDLVIEVVAEVLAIKEKVFGWVAQNRKPGSIVASNTSGIPLAVMAKSMSDDMRAHFVITHFFNPVRYMQLLEIVSGADTLPSVSAAVAAFGERVLGKGIVYAKDTPAFVANRVGTYGMCSVFHHMARLGLTVEQVDAVFGKAMGRPDSAVFRTADLVGIDTLAHVIQGIHDSCPADEERGRFVVPAYVASLIEAKRLGDKTGSGFYKKVKNAEGKSEILALDLATLEYRPSEKVRFPCLGAARNAETAAEKAKIILAGTDVAAQFAWSVTADTLIYAANRVGEIADDVVNIDRGMRWGFRWEQGPFQTWDALGVQATADRMEAEGRVVPGWVKDMLASGRSSFYARDGEGSLTFAARDRSAPRVPRSVGQLSLADVKARGGEIDSNVSASLLDLGDGVLGLEFHSKMNALDDAIFPMYGKALDLLDADKYQALVVGNQAYEQGGTAFCAGANIMMVLMFAMQGDWAGLEGAVKGMQDGLMRAKYSKKPIVTAPWGLTLGGGVEVTMHSAATVACGEMYSGLVEVGVGLLPAGGGCKEMLFRYLGDIPPGVAYDPNPYVQKVFEYIATAKIFMSAGEAQDGRFLRVTDRVEMDPEAVIGSAKRAALGLVAGGYQPPRRKTIKVPGVSGRATLELGLYQFNKGGQATDYDVVVGKKVAHVLCGGDVPAGAVRTEQDILDLEREAFLSLCGNPQTQARIQHMLEKGKPLRN
ncbi:MAG: 3-hydroxyacyl-CoA dehydrogenase/enoyl-CoA hydratase family protein [Deltaproteobacteria bacterium]|nr:3-hydroxyacyl-CoA dehydrogenase/enoyl-CoA hydratase family protein [Deltaproteobacteria bacterium]